MELMPSFIAAIASTVEGEKHALVSTRLKKPNLNPDDLHSYWPISNLSFTSKLVERAVSTRFVAHC